MGVRSATRSALVCVHVYVCACTCACALRDKGISLIFPCRYTFYDGPPFATGLPHYGHILAGTIKVGTPV